MPIYLGDRVTLEATFKDIGGTNYDPEEIKAYIYDPKNGLDTTISGASIEKQSTGIYRTEYDIPQDGLPGTWRVVWEARIGAGYKREQMTFSVSSI